MAQNHSEITDPSGLVLAGFTADTDMGGVALEFYGIWHSPALLDQYIAALQEYAQWLRDRGVT